MPYKPRRPCRYPGCPEMAQQGQVFCKDHIEWSGERIRGSADTRGYNTRWRKARALFLRQHPLCEECLKSKIITPATVVDHIVPHRGDKRLFWDQQNWQSLCKEHHDRKTGSGL